VVGTAARAAPAPDTTAGRPTCIGRSSSSAGNVFVPILMYHRVNIASAATPEITRRLTVAPALFARQMRWLHDNGYRTITQRELLATLRCGRSLGRRPVMITFDDGYRDAFFRASPVLLRFRMRATAYVITGRISTGDSDVLTWPLLRALEARGVEIGSHTVSHVDLTTLGDERATRELRGSRLRLERVLGHTMPWLAYPFGAWNPHVERLAREAGYALAVTTDAGALQRSRRPLALRRIRVLDTTSVPALAAMLDSSALA
jgi:peptidoglycan/xylan/chitin deacetylase (PgdA/CDA1 family)